MYFSFKCNLSYTYAALCPLSYPLIQINVRCICMWAYVHACRYMIGNKFCQGSEEAASYAFPQRAASISTHIHRQNTASMAAPPAHTNIFTWAVIYLHTFMDFFLTDTAKPPTVLIVMHHSSVEVMGFFFFSVSFIHYRGNISSEKLDKSVLCLSPPGCLFRRIR